MWRRLKRAPWKLRKIYGMIEFFVIGNKWPILLSLYNCKSCQEEGLKVSPETLIEKLDEEWPKSMDNDYASWRYLHWTCTSISCRSESIVDARPKVIDLSPSLGPKVLRTILHYKDSVKQKVDSTIFDTGCQKNLVSTSLLQKLNLWTTSHPNPYPPLGLLHEDMKMKINWQCKICFTITSQYINEVMCKVAPLRHLLRHP